jgi:hypothetical protein
MFQHCEIKSENLGRCQELNSQLLRLRATERSIVSEVVELLSIVEETRAHLELGYSSSL